MPSTIIVGGQYGSEGKGKVTALIANGMDAPWVVRCGGPNSGHTTSLHGQSIVLRQMPSCPEHPNATFLIAAGCVIDERVLAAEIDLLDIPQDRIIVDPRAVLLTEQDRMNESDSLRHIASTLTGTGAALVRRMSRSNDTQLARDSSFINKRCTVRTVAGLLHDVLEKGGDVLVEGTQGFALSLLHGADYPYVTSRDTTASAFAMEAGLSPRHIDNIVMVIRTFPIRVGGDSGPFANEITWNKVQKISNAPELVPEFTSVTKRLRRVAEFDIEAVKNSCRYNMPTSLAIMGLDRMDYGNYQVSNFEQLTLSAKDFISFVNRETSVPISWVGTGFSTYEAISISNKFNFLEIRYASTTA